MRRVKSGEPEGGTLEMIARTETRSMYSWNFYRDEVGVKIAVDNAKQGSPRGEAPSKPKPRLDSLGGTYRTRVRISPGDTFWRDAHMLISHLSSVGRAAVL